MDLFTKMHLVLLQNNPVFRTKWILQIHLIVWKLIPFDRVHQDKSPDVSFALIG